MDGALLRVIIYFAVFASIFIYVIVSMRDIGSARERAKTRRIVKRHYPHLLADFLALDEFLHDEFLHRGDDVYRDDVDDAAIEELECELFDLFFECESKIYGNLKPKMERQTVGAEFALLVEKMETLRAKINAVKRSPA